MTACAEDSTSTLTPLQTRTGLGFSAICDYDPSSTTRTHEFLAPCPTFDLDKAAFPTKYANILP